VPYAFVEDIAASWEQYDRFAAAFDGPLPEGLLLHAAGPTDEGFRIIGVWESEAAWDRFRLERLGGPDGDVVGEMRPTVRVLRPAHLVHGVRHGVPVPSGERRRHDRHGRDMTSPAGSVLPDAGVGTSEGGRE
jgi:hypothetical protein